MLRIHILALVATNLGSAIFTAGFVLLIKGAPKKPKTVQPRRARRAEFATLIAAASGETCIVDGCDELRVPHSGLCQGHEDLAARAGQAVLAELDESADDGWYDDDDDTYPHADQPINRQRFEWRSDPAASMRAERRIWGDEGLALRTAVADLRASTPRTGHLAAIYGEPEPEHFASAHITPEMQAILDKAGWGSLRGGELTAALTAARVGMPTGSYLVVGSGPGSLPRQPRWSQMYEAAQRSKAGAR